MQLTSSVMKVSRQRSRENTQTHLGSAKRCIRGATFAAAGSGETPTSLCSMSRARACDRARLKTTAPLRCPPFDGNEVTKLRKF